MTGIWNAFIDMFDTATIATPTESLAFDGEVP